MFYKWKHNTPVPVRDFHDLIYINNVHEKQKHIYENILNCFTVVTKDEFACERTHTYLFKHIYIQKRCYMFKNYVLCKSWTHTLLSSYTNMDSDEYCHSDKDTICQVIHTLFNVHMFCTQITLFSHYDWKTQSYCIHTFISMQRVMSGMCIPLSSYVPEVNFLKFILSLTRWKF